MEESIGANREAAKLAAKVLPHCGIFTGTAHGVSKGSHGGIRELLRGSG